MITDISSLDATLDEERKKKDLDGRMWSEELTIRDLTVSGVYRERQIKRWRPLRTSWFAGPKAALLHRIIIHCPDGNDRLFFRPGA